MVKQMCVFLGNYIYWQIEGSRLCTLYFNDPKILFHYEIDYSDESHSSTTILSTLAIIFLSLDEMDSFTFDLWLQSMSLRWVRL